MHLVGQSRNLIGEAHAMGAAQSTATGIAQSTTQRDAVARRVPGQSYALDRYARIGLWALPVYGLANFISTLSSQPDYKKAGEFPAYARYIITSKFLASHLVASILGTGIAILGFTALFVYLVSRSRPAVSLAGFVTTVLGNMGLVAIFGVAAFAQRAIGKAFLAGHHEVIKSLNSAVYSTPLEVTSGVAIALVFAGMILFAIAISASESLPKAAGILLAAWFPLFAIGSIMGNVLDSIGSLILIASTIWIARSASQAPHASRSAP
jgi:hypothetical protein